MTNVVLVCGDSTGVSATHSVAAPFEFTGVSPWTSCVVAEQLLEERFGVDTWAFVNKSYGGTGWGDWLIGKPAIGIPPFAQLLDENPLANIIYVELSINNAINNGTVSGVEYAITQMHSIASSKGRKLVLGTPNPVVYPGRPEVNALLEQMKNAIETKGAALNIPVVNHWAAAVALPKSIWTKLLADGIHPREDYYRWKGQMLYMALAYMAL